MLLFITPIKNKSKNFAKLYLSINTKIPFHIKILIKTDSIL